MEAKTLKQHRQDAYLSTRELAKRAGVSYATISRIENGRVGNVWPVTIRAIAEALGVQPNEVREFRRDNAEA